MEGLSVSLYRRYWSKKGYERINGSGRRWRRRVVLGGGSSVEQQRKRRRRRLWGIKIKVRPKLAFFKKISSPRKLFIWLRDAYVKMMLSLANSRVMGASYGGVIDNGIGALGKGSIKEYDEKMIIEIYKSLATAQGQLVVHRNAANRFGNSMTELAAIAE